MNPQLSIVVTGRNDDYGGDFVFRLQNSVRWWSYFVRQYKITTEYVFVNWNPLPNKPSLFETIQWHTHTYFKLKFIEVPPTVHQVYDKPEVRKKNELYEFIAKNTGIRRATGEYILSTNADILCDPKIFEYIAGAKLNRQSFYRADRYDYRITHDVSSLSYQQQLEHIRNNVFLVQGFGHVFPFSYKGNIQKSFYKIRTKNKFFLRWQLLKRKYHKFFTFFRFNIVFNNAEYYVHTSAAGDFMLMHRQRWQELKAYSENFYMTLHNDSEMVFNAYALGLKMQIMDYPIYHQEHERRYAATNTEMQREGYKVYKQFQEKAQRLLKTMAPEISNQDDWGLKQFDLEIKHA